MHVDSSINPRCFSWSPSWHENGSSSRYMIHAVGPADEMAWATNGLAVILRSPLS